jgi:hypothetical protein
MHPAVLAELHLKYRITDKVIELLSAARLKRFRIVPYLLQQAWKVSELLRFALQGGRTSICNLTSHLLNL